MGIELFTLLLIFTVVTGILALGCLIDPLLARWFDDY